MHPAGLSQSNNSLQTTDENGKYPPQYFPLSVAELVTGLIVIITTGALLLPGHKAFPSLPWLQSAGVFASSEGKWGEGVTAGQMWNVGRDGHICVQGEDGQLERVWPGETLLLMNWVCK